MDDTKFIVFFNIMHVFILNAVTMKEKPIGHTQALE